MPFVLHYLHFQANSWLTMFIVHLHVSLCAQLIRTFLHWLNFLKGAKEIMPHSELCVINDKSPIHLWLILLHCFSIFTFLYSVALRNRGCLYWHKLLMVVSKTIISESLPHNNWECICARKWNSFVIKAGVFHELWCLFTGGWGLTEIPLSRHVVIHTIACFSFCVRQTVHYLSSLSSSPLWSF